MPKGFGGGGGVGAGMPRPMPNPRFNPAPAPAAGGMGGGLFPNMGAQQRYDMAMGLLKNGMQMGAESGSLLAAFLSPLAGAALGGSITNKYEKAKAAEVDDITAAEQTKIDAVNAARGKTPKAAAPAAPTGPVVIDGYTIEQID